MRTYTVRYSHNNSGGRDWLTREDWSNLERDGWTLEGHHEATLRVPAQTMNDAIAFAVSAWESVVNQDTDAIGCECCGRPHRFMCLWDETTED